jgi:hypothetical protein
MIGLKGAIKLRSEDDVESWCGIPGVRKEKGVWLTCGSRRS